MVWHIWKNRNLFIFQGNQWNIDEMIRSSYSWALQYIFSQKSLCSNKPTTKRSVTREGNWVDLNTNGAMKLDSGMAIAEGILKDSKGVGSLGLTGAWVGVQFLMQNYGVFLMA
ncbi:hypothetical protein J1N35_008129 [Gossypium stocksii]|uniref:RNase H type-1 domain-containing protein n=1 Tax=Gossypium stocksii TaxID=47602 RepID=A0A9D4AGC2_9ROSI|nr:hypothetical protein J1N35_008129 [Gossypium stocksii]